jgi:acyl dehydratase
MPPAYRGKTFEDLEEGQEWWTPGRTITQADNLLTLAVSGDFNPLHSDQPFAEEDTEFGQRAPPGYLSIMVMFGFVDRLGITEGVGRALLNLNWDWDAPVLLGDTIHARICVDELNDISNPEAAIVTYGVEIYNQDEEQVQDGEFTILVDRN